MDRDVDSPARPDHATLCADTFAAPVRARFRCGDAHETTRPGWSQLMTPSIPLHWRNEVSLSVLGDEADAVIDATLADYAARGLPVRWLVGPPTRPQDTAARLAARGFGQHEVLGMAVPTDVHVPAPGHVAVRQLGLADVQLWSDACSTGWDSPASQRIVDDWRWAFAQPERLFYLATVDGQPVGTGAVVLTPDSAYLVGGQVAAAHRGQGIYRALLAARLAAVRPLRAMATTQAVATTSAPILTRLGFETLFRCVVCTSPT